MSRLVSKGIVGVMFSPWSTLWVAAGIAIALLVAGAGPADRIFWILLTAVLGPFVLFELGSYVIYARRGQSYFEFKRRLGELTIAEVQRRKEGGRP